MADTKISALTALTGANVASDDVLPIVDTSVTTTKKIAASELKIYMSDSPTFVTPTLGTPASGNFSTGTFTWPTFNQNTSGTAAGLSATLVASSGGTGQYSYAIGDLLYASSSTTLAKLADVVTGNALLSGGVGVAPAWGQVGLTTHVTGTLPIANGGSNATSFTSGYPIYFNGTSFAQGTTSTKELSWDNSNGRLGIGTASPSVRFHLIGGRSTFAANSESFAMYVQYNSATTGYYFGGSSDSGLSFSTGGGSEAMRIGAGRNLLIGATVEPTSSYFNLVLGTGGAPSADPAAGLCALWFDGTNLKARVGASTKTITWA